LRIGVAGAFALLCMMVGTLPANASASTSTTISTVQINQSTFALCANGGAGEVINISGTMSSLFHITIDDSGGTHSVLKEDNLRGVQGIGEITGNKYQLIRANTQTFEVNSGGLPITVTFESNFKLISHGSDSDNLAHILRHITINENGTVTTEIEKISAVCT
jgi:hypothetical protein